MTEENQNVNIAAGESPPPETISDEAKEQAALIELREWRMFYEFCGRDVCFLARKEGDAK